MRHGTLACVGLFVLGLIATGASAVRAQLGYTEDFTTTTYMDALNTTADWNTVSGELRLFPFMITNIGSYDTAGNAFHVVVSGDLAFVADDPDVVIFDITDPANPTLLGTFAAGDAQAVFYAGDLLYVAAGTAGLTIVDISDPTTPVQVGNLNTPAQALDVVVEGNVAYVANQATGVIVVDVTNPAAPTQIGLYDTPNQAHGVDVSGDHCYVADRGSSGVIVLDVSDPTTPTLAGGLVMPGDTWNIDIDGDLAYVSDAGASGLGLAILDVSDPTNPTLLGSVDPGTVRNIDVSGDMVYAAGFGDVHVIDVSDPANPFVIESWTTPGIASAVAVDGEHAFVADGTVGGLQVLRVRTVVSDPVEVGSVATPGLAGQVAIAGDHAFLAAYDAGLRVLDISDPSAPVEVGSIDTLGFSYSGTVALAGNHAFVGGASGLRVIDITDPTSPGQVGFHATTSSVNDVALAGDLAFLTNSAGLRVIDISSPSNPVEVGFFDPGGSMSAVEVVGDHAFVAASSVGLRIVDVSDPAAPVLLGSIDPGSANDVAVAGDRAFLTGSSLGLRIINISNPASPFQEGMIDTLKALDVVVEGNQAFVTTGFYSHLHVIDISNTFAPADIGFFAAPDYAIGLALAGEHVFLANYTSGLRVIQVFQSELDVVNDRGQSLTINNGDTVLRARLTTTQTGDVTWRFAVNGTNFQPTESDGTWHKFNVPGTDLRWRSTHQPVGFSVNPAVSHMNIEWLGEPAQSNGIADVPDDQGGWVRVALTRSGYDFADETTSPTTGYQVYRRVDGALAAQVIRTGTPLMALDGRGALPGLDAPRLRSLGDRKFVVGPSMAGTFPPGTWEVVSWVAATQSDDYMAVVPTLVDSMASGENWTVCMVTTHTTTPSVWFASAPDSGYSVDNIAPGVPQSFAIAYNTGSGNTLSWNDAPEPDFQYYRVYRSTDPNFTPTPGDLVHETALPNWIDPDFDGWNVYYKVTALDHAGNESDPTGGGTVTAVDDPPAPARLALHGNVPNPFNPSTVIRYDVPPAGSSVEIMVFDITGRHVRTLVNEAVPGGNHHVTWDGRNDGGQSVATGVYLYRMRAGSFVETRKMLLVK